MMAHASFDNQKMTSIDGVSKEKLEMDKSLQILENALRS